MSATNHTKNLNLPQFEATDKPSWLGDINGAMLSIDDGYGEQQTAIANARDNAASASAQANANQVAVTQLNKEAESLDQRVTALEAGAGTEEITQRINSLENDQESTEQRVDNIEDDVQTLTTNVSTLQTNVANEVKTLTDATGELESDLTALQGQVEQNKESINAQQGEITALNATTNGLTTSKANGDMINIARVKDDQNFMFPLIEFLGHKKAALIICPTSRHIDLLNPIGSYTTARFPGKNVTDATIENKEFTIPSNINLLEFIYILLM